MNLLRLGRILLLALVILNLVACESTKKKDLKPVELESFDAEIDIDKIWSKSIGSGLGEYYHQFALALDSNYIYAAAENGKVYQLDKMNGDERWKVSLDTKLSVGVSIDDEHVYIGALDGALIALNKSNGKQVWSKKLGSEIVCPPNANFTHLIVQTANGQVFDLDTKTGEQHWRFDSNMPALTLRGNSGAQFFSNYTVIGLSNGKLAVIDLETGQLRWDPKITDPKGDSEIERIVDVDSTPLILNETVYAVSYQGRLVAYDLKTGRLLWAEDESSYRDITSGFSNIYVSSSNSLVTAYDQVSGDVKWSVDTFLRRKISAPTPVSSFIAVADFEGYVHLLSQLDGHLVARKNVNGSGIKTTIVADGNRFYAIANDGKLKAYELGEEIK